VFDDIVIYGLRDELIASPLVVIVEVYDYDVVVSVHSSHPRRLLLESISTPLISLGTHTQPFYSSLDFVQHNPGELVAEGSLHFAIFWIFWCKMKITHRQTTQQSGWTATPSRLIGAPMSAIPTIFTLDALPDTTLSIYPGLAQAPNMLACLSGSLVLSPPSAVFQKTCTTAQKT